MSTAPVSPPAPPASPAEPEDASRREIVYYAVGNVESGVANQFYGLINSLLVVALGMNPLLLGFVLAIKTFWDGVTDPIMAQITDKARTRWGRRRPFILVGGVARSLFLVAIFVFFPRDASIIPNAELAKTHEAAVASAETSAATRAEPDHTPASDNASDNAPDSSPPRPGLLGTIAGGWDAFNDANNVYHRQVTIYLLVACLIFTTLTTVNSVPYYALGIELCPSYDGRTRVVTYRSAVEKATGLLGPWILPFCFLPVFGTVIDGLAWYAVIVAIIGIPTTVLMFLHTRERFATTAAVVDGPGLFRSIWLTAKNVHFLKILFLYQFIGYTNGVFQHIGFFLIIYWVYEGDALAGATLGGYAGSLGTLLAFVSLPLINWACRRLQKHRALRYSVLWMSLGTALNWVLVDPDHPYLQLILPFFFSVGISAVYMVLPSMMADVTDIDELENGVRREGMFGAVMAFLMKVTGTLQPVLAGAILLLSGFDASLGAHQTPETIFNMRVLFSLVPAALLLFALVALWRYPLTREYMEQVKAKLAARRAVVGASSPTA